ncbi:hypothetical protein KFK09_029174 [Dendrobium nobile]|uniref:Uncharacterized protein n=1 Tax=Dendrobium nobile TaxID=94219 RepID=A0A8T3A582_DENNO|nr:hypothetical protein KFK09_029174 [Dendrobium nobile]
MEEVKGSISTTADIIAIQKEWDEISCPICLDHPHNAVLLICRSHEKGCRSYICDTSYRHSNCLDRFAKLRTNHGNNSDPSTEQHNRARTDRTLASNSSLTNPMARRNSNGNQNDQGHLENNTRIVYSISESMAEGNRDHHDRNMQESNILICPLCRETVSGWMIVNEIRQYLNLKSRSCSRELCSFSGNYKELRQHARRVHPATRPTDIDPSRQRAWRRFEDQREYGDILSAIRSAMPGAVVLGDYVIDSGDDLPQDGRSWLSTFLLLRMINGSSIGLLDEPRGSSRPWRMDRRSYGRHTVWDQNLLGLHGGGGGGDDNDDDLSPNDDVMIPRRRRRFTRFRHNEEQQ